MIRYIKTLLILAMFSMQSFASGVPFEQVGTKICQDCTPLHGEYDPDKVQALLASGANPNAVCCFKATPLHMAKSAQIVQMLLQAGADPHAVTSQGSNALHFARDAESVRILAQRGVALNKKNDYGDTPLHANIQNPDVTQALLEAGADPNIIGPYGYSPLRLCRVYENKNPGCEAILLQYGADPAMRNQYGDTYDTDVGYKEFVRKSKLKEKEEHDRRYASQKILEDLWKPSILVCMLLYILWARKYKGFYANVMKRKTIHPIWVLTIFLHPITMFAAFQSILFFGEGVLFFLFAFAYHGIIIFKNLYKYGFKDRNSVLWFLKIYSLKNISYILLLPIFMLLHAHDGVTAGFLLIYSIVPIFIVVALAWPKSSEFMKFALEERKGLGADPKATAS